MFVFACAPRFKDYGLGWDVAHFEDLGPAIAEPSIANDQAFFVCGKLSRYGFHAECATAGYDDDRAGAIHFFECGGDISHDALEGLRHVVERAVCIDHGVFQEFIGVTIGR